MARAEPSAFVRHIQDELSGIGAVQLDRFFGGWAYLLADKRFAVSIKDRLYFRVDRALKDALVAEGCQPFSYAKGGKTVVVHRFYEAPQDCLDDRDALLHWANRALAAEDDDLR